MKTIKYLPVLLSVLAVMGCTHNGTTRDDYWGKPATQEYADENATVLFDYSDATLCPRTLIGYAPDKHYNGRVQFVQFSREGSMGGYFFSPAEAMEYASQLRVFVHSDRKSYGSITIGPKVSDGKRVRILISNAVTLRKPNEMMHAFQIKDLETHDTVMNVWCHMDAKFFAGMAQAFENAARMDQGNSNF